MSAPMDVLAVLDAYANLAASMGNDDSCARAAKARAAVAELIEAAGVLLAEWDRQDHGKFDGMTAKAFFAAEARFRAALARCGGES